MRESSLLGSKSSATRRSAEKVPQSGGRRPLCAWPSAIAVEPAPQSLEPAENAADILAFGSDSSRLPASRARDARVGASALRSPAVRSRPRRSNRLPTSRLSTRQVATRSVAIRWSRPGAGKSGTEGQICPNISGGAIRERSARTSEVRREARREVRQESSSRGKTRGAMCPDRPPRKTLRVKGLGDKLGYPRATFVPPLIFLQHP